MHRIIYLRSVETFSIISSKLEFRKAAFQSTVAMGQYQTKDSQPQKSDIVQKQSRSDEPFFYVGCVPVATLFDKTGPDHYQLIGNILYSKGNLLATTNELIEKPDGIYHPTFYLIYPSKWLYGLHWDLHYGIHHIQPVYT